MQNRAEDADAYLAAVPEVRTEAWTRLRELCLMERRGCAEVMAYGMPAYERDCIGEITVCGPEAVRTRALTKVVERSRSTRGALAGAHWQQGNSRCRRCRECAGLRGSGDWSSTGSVAGADGFAVTGPAPAVRAVGDSICVADQRNTVPHPEDVTGQRRCRTGASGRSSRTRWRHAYSCSDGARWTLVSGRYTSLRDCEALTVEGNRSLTVVMRITGVGVVVSVVPRGLGFASWRRGGH